MLSGEIQVFDRDIHETSDEARHTIGTVGKTQDGRVYRYAKAGGANLAAGKLCVAATIVANHTNIAVASAAAVNSNEVTVTLGATAATANQYAGGYLVVNDAAGEGSTYAISGHPAADSEGSLTIKLKDKIKVALTTSSEVSLVKNLYDSIVISATDQADAPVGVPNVAISSGEYGWVQTKGLCSVLADEAVTAGKSVTIGTGTAGAVQAISLTEATPNTGADQPLVGVAQQALVDTEYRPINLCVD